MGEISILGKLSPLMYLFLFSFPSCTNSSIYLLCRNSNLEITWPQCISAGSWELFGEKVDTSTDNTLHDNWHANATRLQIAQRSRYRHVGWWFCLLCVFWGFPRWPRFATSSSSAPHTPVCHQLITDSIRSLAPSGFLHLVPHCFCGCVLAVVFSVALVRFTDLCAPCFCFAIWVTSTAPPSVSRHCRASSPHLPPLHHHLPLQLYLNQYIPLFSHIPSACYLLMSPKNNH